jgi:hypothetical protein
MSVHVSRKQVAETIQCLYPQLNRFKIKRCGSKTFVIRAAYGKRKLYSQRESFESALAYFFSEINRKVFCESFD